MINLKTNIPNPNYSFSLNLKESFFLIGSCFSQNIGEKLNSHYLDVLVNPFGVVFNPISIKDQLQTIIKGEVNESQIFEKEGNFFSLQFGSKFFATSEVLFFNKIKESIKSAKQNLESAQLLVITIGTSWVYNHLDTQTVVANCHKIPQKEFDKRLLTIKEIEKSLLDVVRLLNINFPSVKVLFTVSPVRHLKDGFIENNRSKARLIEAVHSVCENQNKADYFPAYEIFMDDLRDYRFYNEDLIHPNNLGVKYVWELFLKSFFKDPDLKLLNKLQKLNSAVSHRQLISNKLESKKHQDYISNLKSELLSAAPYLKSKL